MKTGLYSNLAINKKVFIKEMEANPSLDVQEVECQKGQYLMDVSFKMKGIKDNICVRLGFREFVENAMFFETMNIQDTGGVTIGDVRRKAIEETVKSWFTESMFDRNPTDNPMIEIITGHKFVTKTYRDFNKYAIIIQKINSIDLELLLTETTIERRTFGIEAGAEKETAINYYRYEDNILHEVDEQCLYNNSTYYRDENGRYYTRFVQKWDSNKAIKLFDIHYKKNSIEWKIIGYNHHENAVTYPQLLTLLDEDSSQKVLINGDKTSREYSKIEVHSDLLFKDEEMKVFKPGDLVDFKNEVYLVTEVVDEAKGLYRLLSECDSFEEDYNDVMAWFTKVAHANSLTLHESQELNQNVGKFVYIKHLNQMVEIKEEHPNYYLYDELDARFVTKDRVRRLEVKKTNCLSPCEVNGIDGQQILKESTVEGIFQLLNDGNTKEHFALEMWLKKLTQSSYFEGIRYPLYSILRQDNSPEMALELLEKLYDVVINSSFAYLRIDEGAFIKMCDGETLPKVFE